MHLDLSVIASTTIKRKKPWPKLAWLGKGQGGLFLLDDHRISQLFLPSGKTRKKIPSLQPVLADAQVLNVSPNGLYLAGALGSGKIFVWHKDTESFTWSLVLDKIRNVLLSVFPKPKLFVSNCGRKVLLIFGINQIFLWEAHGSAQEDESSGGRWLQVQSGDCCLPCQTDKEMAIDGSFYVDSVLGMCGACAWIFNRGDKIQISTLKLQWPTVTQHFGDTRDGIQGVPTFTAKWSSFGHSLYGLTSAKRVLKSRKAYLGRFSPDGQVLAVAMNQKSAVDNKVMFFNPSTIPVAVIADLKGCGARVGVSKQITGRSWWIADMKWTRDSLFLVCITKRGSVGIVTKLGEPVQISVNGCSVNMGPGLFLPLHPRILFKKPTSTDARDSSLSTCSETDVLQQKFTVSAHPSQPLLLTSDGYLVTIIQLPSSLNPASVMNSLVADVARLVPDIKLDLGSQDDNDSQFSRENKVNLLQSEFSLQPGGGEGDAVSLQSFSSGSSMVPGYGLASGDQGVGYFGVDDTTDIGSLDGDIPVDIDCSLEARNITLMALGLATACAGNWKREYGAARNAVTCAVTSVFQLMIKRKRSHSTPVKLNPVESLKVLPRSIREFTNDDPSILDDEVSLEDPLNFYKMAVELFKWDSLHQNVLSWAVHLTGGIVRQLLSTRTAGEHAKVSGCLQLLRHAERLLTLIYYRDTEEGGVVCGLRDPPTVPVRQDDRVQYTTRSSIATQLSGSWLILYRYVSQACKKSHPSAREHRPGSEHSMLTYLCEVQRKLQELGVRIPSQAIVESPSYLKGVPGLKQHLAEGVRGTPGLVHRDNPSSLVVSPLPQDSMFARRRMNQTTSQDETRRNLDRSLAVALFHRPVFSKQLSGSGSAVDSETADTQTMLSILYLNLRQYEMRAAVDLVFSLLDPLRSLDQGAPEASTSFAPSGESSFVTSDHGPNTMLRILLQTYPMARVAQQRGMEVVQTLARVMAAYFSNLPLYIFPPYCPFPLPPYNFGQEKDRQDWEALQLSQSMEILEIDRTKVAKAVREQDLSEVWSANSALELMLVSGLMAEAAWLARNLGDWKHAFILSVAHYKFEDKRRSVVLISPERRLTFPAAPEGLQPDQIIMSRLELLLLDTKPLEGVSQTNQVGESDKGQKASQNKRSTETNSKRQQSDLDERLSREVTQILEASVVVGLDMVPTLLTNLIGELKARVTSFSWIVPQGFYLPSPPLYCPQPPYTKYPVRGLQDKASSEVQEERCIRSDVVDLVRKILTVLQSSRCAVPCVRWYTDRLVECSERWGGVPRDQGDFPIPPSLVECATTGFCFTDGSRLSPGKGLKKKKSPKKGKATDKSAGALPPSVCTVTRCFRELCLVMWLIHVRDEMGACARKYRRLRTEVTGVEKREGAVEQQCWETLQWTSRLIPYGEYLGCASDIRDALLTLISELPPLPSTAQLCAQFFHDPTSIDSISGKAKLKRLMAQFRSVSVEGIDGTGEAHEETLSILYRRKCVEWQHEMKQRRKVMGVVREHVFGTRGTGAERPGSAGKGQSEDPVGSLLLETDQSYFEFLDTFFIITFSKSSPPQLAQIIEPIPVLTPYSERFLAADTRTLADIRRKKTAERPSEPNARSSLYRSHSFTDVRSSGFKRGNLQHADKLTSKDDGAIKRVSSLNDLRRLGAMSGFNSLGKDLLDLLPVLVWLNRWVYEGVTSAGSTFDVSTSAVSKIHPLMRVHVPLPLTINCMWLLKNIYFPWITREQVWKPKMKPQDVVSESNVLHRDDNTNPSGLNKVADNSPSTLIRVTQLPQNVLRDDDIVEVSPARNILASSLHLSHLAEDNVRGATGLQAVDHDVQGAAELQAADHGVRGAAELQAADHDVRGAAKFQAAADHDEVPAILVQSPTSDEATFPHPGASGRGGKQRKGGQMNMTDNGRTEMDLKKRADQERQYKQRSPKSSINRVNRKPKKGESATPDVSRLPYRRTEGKRSKNHKGGAEEEECVEVLHDDVSGSRTSVAIATALSSKQPRRSATAREKNRVSSDLLNSDLSDATSWMSTSEANEQTSRFKQTKSGRRLPTSSRGTARKSRDETETQQLQLLSQSGVDAQSEMEVFLVLRPRDGSSKSTAVRTEIPLVKLPNESTVTSFSEGTLRNTKQSSRVKDAVSQTLHTYSHQMTMERFPASSQSQTEPPNQLSGQRYNKFSTVSKTSTENGESRKDKTSSNLQQPMSKYDEQSTPTSISVKREISIATQTSSDLDEVMKGSAPAVTSNPEHFKGSIGTQTDSSIPYESANVHKRQPETFQQHTFHLLKLEKPSLTTQTVELNASKPVFNSVEPTTSSTNVHPYFTSSRIRASTLNFGKPRIAWPSAAAAELPLLFMPESTVAAEHRPDITKIKFLETCPKPSARPLLEIANTPRNLNMSNEPKLVKLDSQKPVQPEMSWPLLRFPESGQSQKPDLSKMRLLERPELSEAIGLPLLKFPTTKQRVPSLVPYEAVLAFEQSRTKRAWIPKEKENVVPADVQQGQRGSVGLPEGEMEFQRGEDHPASQPLKLIHVQPAEILQPENEETDRRNTTSRQRRRNKIDQTDLEVSQQQHGPSRTRAQLQGHPRAVRTVFVEPQKHRKKAATKKRSARPSKLKTGEQTIPNVGKSLRTKEVVYYESLSEESELELSKISDVADSLSEDEKYFCVEANSPPSQPKSSLLQQFEVPGPPVLMHYQRKRALEAEDKQPARNVAPGHREDISKGHFRLGAHIGSKIRDVKRSDSPSEEFPRNTKKTSDKSVSVRFEDEIATPREVPNRRAIGVQVESNIETPWRGAHVVPQDTPIKNEAKTVLVQTDETLLPTPTDQVNRRAPALPPDIFMNLKFPAADVPDDQEAGVESPVAAPMSVTARDSKATPESVAQSTRQFLSVADIDHEKWGNVKNSPQFFPIPDNEKQGNSVSQSLKAPLAAKQDSKQSFAKDEWEQELESELKERSSSSEPEVVTANGLDRPSATRPARVHLPVASAGPDSMTVKLMDSIDSPLQSRQRVDPRAASKQWIAEHMKQMTQTMDAIEQVNDNVDRDLQSSRMLMNAIERLGEAVYPASKPAFVVPRLSNQEYTRDKLTRMPELTPRESFDRGGTRAMEDVDEEQEHDTNNDDSIDVTSPRPRETNLDTTEHKVQVETGSPTGGTGLSGSGDVSQASHAPSDEEMKDESVRSLASSVQSRSTSRGNETSTERDRKDQQKLDALVQGGKQLVPSSAGDTLQSFKISQDKLKEMLGLDDKTSNRVVGRTPEKKRKLREWMNKKRAEQHSQWASKMEELRAAEYKPYATEGVSSSKKIKLAQKERSIKRREREGVHYEERMKSATNLLSDMLTEPKPDLTVFQPNLRYSRATGKLVRPRNNKKPFNNRYKRKTSSMRSDRGGQQGSKKWPGVESQEITADLTDIDANSWRHSTPVWSVTDDVRQDDLFRKTQRRTPVPTAQEFVTVDTYRKHEAQKLRKSKELDDELVDSYHPLGEENAVGSVIQELSDNVRPESPSGPNFITRKSWERYQKDSKRRSTELQKETERQIRQCGELEFDPHGPPVLDRGADALYSSRADSQGGQTFADIDKLLEGIPDGSSMDEDKLRGLQSLLNDDSELKELLADVFDRTASPVGDHPQEPRGTFQITSAKRGELVPKGTNRSKGAPQSRGAPLTKGSAAERKKPIPKPRVTNVNFNQGNQAAGNSLSHRGPKGEFDDIVSPWSTNDSLQMSDDIAQLLAEAKEAVGEDFSESSGSIMSNIDWQAVDKIMDEIQ